MSSQMRWGDSDSSDEEAYVPSKKPQQDDDIHQGVSGTDNVVTEPASPPRPYNDRGQNRRDHDHHHDSHSQSGNNSNYHNNDRSKGRSNRMQQRDRGGGGRTGGSSNHHSQRSGDWRVMAKSASRFSTGGV